MMRPSRCGGAALAVALACGSTAGQQPPDAAACRELLQRLDAAYNRGDVAGYLGLFAAEQPLLHDLHGREIRRRLDAGRPQRRASELGEPRWCGDHVVMPVQWITRLADDRAPLREDALVVARRRGDTLVPVFAVDVPAGSACSDDAFTCAACNYRIGGAHGWLFVPIAGERTAAIEGATFLLLGTDVALEVSVQVGDASLPATAVAGDVAHSLAARVPQSVALAVEAWQPPSLPAPEDGGPSAARAVVDLPDGQRLVAHAVVFGRLRHLLLLRGDRTALLAQTQAIAALLATYRILAVGPDAADTAARSLLAHTGGQLTDAGYQNDRYALTAAGPAGWRGSQRGGGGAFHLVWTCPERSGRMWLQGFRPPTGFAAWTPELADRWLADLLQRAALAATAAPSPWSAADTSGHRSRRVVAAPTAAAPAGTPGRTLVLHLADDLLVVADGYTADATQTAALERALASVRRP